MPPLSIRLFAALTLVAGLLLVWHSATAAPQPQNEPGLPKRVPWTTSRVQGSPEPPDPYRTERAFPNLKLNQPTDLALSPLGDRFVVTEQNATVQSFLNRPDATATPFLDLRGPNQIHGKRQLWSSTFHPNFAKNGYWYVCYHDPKPTPPRCRISRFEVDVKDGKTAAVAKPDSEFIVAEWLAGEDHWGGCLKFGKDGFLYFSVGDGNGYGDGFISGQDLSDFNASILRIDVDKPNHAKAYGIPADNPFLKTPNARPEIWAYGTRNIWKMSFDRDTGDLWGADVGQDLWEMVYRVEKGGNYGWSVVEGTQPFRPERKVGPTPILKPVATHDHSEARSITGGFVYRGKRLPDLAGSYVYGDFDTGKIWGVKADGKPPRELVDTPYRIVGFAEDEAGDLLILDYTGGIYRLALSEAKAKAGHEFPRLLSETGLFASTAEYRVADGVIPYAVNSPLWSDDAIKQRYIAIPGDGKIQYDATNSWGFPEGTVLVKTFALPLVKGDPKSARRLETRLMHLEENHWRGYTYVWNAAQTDAKLAPKRGLDETFSVADTAAPGGKREQTWHYPSRAECTLCHTMPVRFVLGLCTAQMNRDFDYGSVIPGGKPAPQLKTLAAIGMFERPPALDGKGALPRLADPADAKEPIDARARSYLHANCAHCHMKWGGGNALFWTNWQSSLGDMKILNVPPMHGNLGIDGACLVVPGSPEKSLLLDRMKRTDEKRMPRAASSLTDKLGVDLVGEWIRALPKP